MNDSFFYALDNPYRRDIIKLLKWQNLSVNEICQYLGISQPSVSRHIEILKQASIIVTEKKSNQTICSLNMSAAEEIYLQIYELFDKGTDKEGGGVIHV